MSPGRNRLCELADFFRFREKYNEIYHMQPEFAPGSGIVLLASFKDLFSPPIQLYSIAVTYREFGIINVFAFGNHPRLPFTRHI